MNVALGSALAMAAAKLSCELKLAWQTASSWPRRANSKPKAALWTQDADFENLPGARYVAAVRA